MRTRSPLAPPSLALCLSAALAACSASPTPAADPPAVAPVEAPTPPPAPPSGAAGKLAPGMVGTVSPVPAFRGGGEHWRIRIEAEGGPSPEGLRHRVALTWGMGEREAGGAVYFRGTPGPSRGAPIALDGRLDTPAGARTLRIEIRTEPCVDLDGSTRPQQATVSLEGETPMTGCGELAVY
ncbi:MAG: hypothetical protein ACOY82_14655 [Pseudomonadota bacterium]